MRRLQVSWPALVPATLLAACSGGGPTAPFLGVSGGLPAASQSVRATALVATSAEYSPAEKQLSYKIFVGSYSGGTLTTYTKAGKKSSPSITGLGEPQGVAVDADGKIYIANFNGSTLTTYDANGVQTTPTITGLSNPVGVAVDASGKIYIVSQGTGTLTTYNANGSQTTPTITGLVMPTGRGCGRHRKNLRGKLRQRHADDVHRRWDGDQADG